MTTIYSFDLPRLACFCSSESVHGEMAKPAGGAVAVGEFVDQALGQLVSTNV